MYLDHTTTEEDLSLLTTYTKIEPDSSDINIYTSTIRSLSLQLSLGNLTSLQIVTAYLRQIELHNSRLKALIHVAPREELMALARELDNERQKGNCRGALHGIPIIVKDNIETDPSLGMPTTAGSYALLNLPVKRDAFLVRKLREAGAIILGKANLSELASYKSLNADGWSAVGGQTINAYAPHASPGSSSAGNGVSIAAGFCPASVGTDTDGSIVFPCFASALYGLKPTHGLISRTGIVPFAPTFDSAGPMGKTPWDLAVLLNVMSCEDGEDLATIGVQRLEEGVKYTDSSANPSFQGLRIGIPRQNWHDVEPWKRANRPVLSPEISAAFESAVSRMVNAGAIIVDPADIPSAVDGTLWECAAGARSVIVNADCKEYLGTYLCVRAGDGGGCRSVEDLIAFNERHSDLELPPDHPSQDVLKRTRHAVPVNSPIYRAAQAEMQLVAGMYGLDAVFDTEGVDVLFSLADGHQSLPNMIGYPMGAYLLEALGSAGRLKNVLVGAVPMGVTKDGVPFGAIFIGRKYGEQTLLAIMSVWEAEFGARPLPPMAAADQVEEAKALAIQASDSARGAVTVAP